MKKSIIVLVFALACAVNLHSQSGVRPPVAVSTSSPFEQVVSWSSEEGDRKCVSLAEALNQLKAKASGKFDWVKGEPNMDYELSGACLNGTYDNLPIKTIINMLVSAKARNGNLAVATFSGNTVTIYPTAKPVVVAPAKVAEVRPAPVVAPTITEQNMASQQIAARALGMDRVDYVGSPYHEYQRVCGLGSGNFAECGNSGLGLPRYNGVGIYGDGGTPRYRGGVDSYSIYGDGATPRYRGGVGYGGYNDYGYGYGYISPERAIKTVDKARHLDRRFNGEEDWSALMLHGPDSTLKYVDVFVNGCNAGPADRLNSPRTNDGRVKLEPDHITRLTFVYKDKDTGYWYQYDTDVNPGSMADLEVVNEGKRKFHEVGVDRTNFFYPDKDKNGKMVPKVVFDPATLPPCQG